MNRINSIVILLVSAAFACACTAREQPSAEAEYNPAHDYFSHANSDQFVTSHLALDLTVDFAASTLRGQASLHLRRLVSAATEVVLDTRDLDITAVAVRDKEGEWVTANYRLGALHAVLGTPLYITLPAGIAGQDLQLKIDYATSPKATALQWLPPELTAGGKLPFLFSQSQAIHARSWIPLQDTPSVRITYEAIIRTPPALLAVMSANNDPAAARDGIYEFDMPQPIPPYLLALAVGNLYFAPLGEDTGVYAEPETLDAAAFEFADTQAMLETAEDMFGPYQWGRYDLLILPPSFPYGGMENPRLSFLTPSLLAGDKSLVDVVAHELAHSWSGNLVTNATWRDGWLNEGMTSYLEKRLMEVIYDNDRADVDNVIGYQELLLDLKSVPTQQQALAPRFDSGDPDDFQGIIAYHKGNLFLQYLESAYGREEFDAFLGDYFADFAFQTITSERFLDYLDQKLLSKHAGRVTRADVEEWLYQPGLPSTAIIPTSEAMDAAAAMAKAWSRGDISAAEVPAATWAPKVVVHFINNIAGDLSDDRLSELDQALALSDTGNAEIARTWFIQVAKRQHRAAYAQMEKHLNRYGRTRLVAPVYEALAANGADRDLALALFAKARVKYHPITISNIDSVFEKTK